MHAVLWYYRPLSRIKWIGSFISFLQYCFHLKKAIDDHIRNNGRPDLVHVQICYKAGLGALYAKWRYGLPYIVSEQWTIFCPEARPGFSDENMVTRWLIRTIYKRAKTVTAVSEYLALALEKKFLIPRPIRIPNVVNTEIFYPDAHTGNNAFRFIHISLLRYQKNPEHIFGAVKLLKQKTALPFELMVYGPPHAGFLDWVRQNGLQNEIIFRQELPQKELAIVLRGCDALILYSRFETFGCVIIEAFASGVPVIVSDIPVMHELVEEGRNGIFIQPEDPEALARGMLWMMENRKLFDTGKVAAEAANMYAYAKIAPLFTELYNKSLEN